MTALNELAEKFVFFSLEMVKDNGVIVGGLAVIGIIGIISATFSKVGKAFQYLFMLFVAFPLIIVVGLFNKDNRKQRLKELGDIRATLKQNPDKGKKLLYYAIFCILVIIVVFVLWWFLYNFVLPFNELNEFSKHALENMTTNRSFG